METARVRRVGIDFHVVDGIFQGSRTHVLDLFSEVIRLSPDMNFVLFLANPDKLRAISSVFSAANVDLVCMPETNPINRLFWQLPRFQRKYHLDILHTQYIIPMPSFCADIVTIHDILFESHPQFFTTFFKLRSKVLIRLSAWRAKHIFTISEYCKSEIINRYGLRSEKISIINCAVDRTRFFAGGSGGDIVAMRGLSSMAYILSVGRLEPRKNHVALLRAYAKLDTVHLPLVIIGQPHFGFDDVFAVMKELKLEDRVRILSDVSDNELPAFYRHARLFVYPSWAEGFGMPPLEAMASGVPVISSNSTAISEMLGEAAVLVEPGNVDALSKAISDFLGDPSAYSEMRARGLARAKLFKWETAAVKVRQVYLAALNM